MTGIIETETLSSAQSCRELRNKDIDSHVFLSLVLLALAGCGSNTSVGNHVSAVGYHGDPRRIMVIAELDDRRGTVDMGSALNLALVRCGIASQVLEPTLLRPARQTKVGTAILKPTLLQPDEQTKLRTAIVAFQPDMIRNLHFVFGWTQYSLPTFNKYVLAATDISQKHEVWKGEVMLWFNGFVERSEVASELAAKIVRDLAEEGIVKSCVGRT